MPHAALTDQRLDTGLLCLVLVSRFFGLPAEAAQLQHRFARAGELCGIRELSRAARHLGLKMREVASDYSRLRQTPVPAIARHRDGHYFIIAGVEPDRVLLQDPLESAPQALPRALFESAWSGRLILVTRRLPGRMRDTRFGFKWFIPALVKHRGLFAEVLLASMFLQLFALITPLFFQVVIDKVLVHRGMTTLDVLALGLIVVSLFEVVLGGLRGYLFSHTSHRIDVLLGSQLFGHLLALPLNYFGSRRIGDTVARVRELESLRGFITGSALTLVIDLLFTGVFLIVMYSYSPLLTLIVLTSIPGYLLLSICVTPLLRERLNEKFDRGAENHAFLVESVGAIETLKAMAIEPQAQRRWEDQLAGYVQASFRAGNLGNIANQVAGFINKLVVVMILWIGARSVIQGELSIGQLIAFNMLAARVSAPVLRLVQLWQDFQQAGVSVKRLGDILNMPTEPGYRESRSALPRLEGRISFERVNFRYRADAVEVLRGLSVEIPAGQVVGVVGRSGSGKSTLARLIQRLYVPEQGRVMVDGVDLALIDAAWLRRRVAVVQQDTVLFNGSVRDNIALSDTALPLATIVEAARLAGAHEFILELPEGYDTWIGERGAALSGGQRQRLAIARALAARPRILILDEATSALDYESERSLQRNMRAICAGRTVLIIAHRLSTLRGADRILVMERGQLVEQGAHDELLRRPGPYAALWAMQTAGSATQAQG